VLGAVPTAILLPGINEFTTIVAPPMVVVSVVPPLLDRADPAWLTFV
jgi:hypothetical protein